jgi:tRNA (adenine57-N1/adenine58-N1)-methyltransferase catalytic subunit
MDFSRPHTQESGVTAKSQIQIVSTETGATELDRLLLKSANQAALNLFQTTDAAEANCTLYTERVLPTSSIIQAGDLVVIFESFDNLTFVYAQAGQRFNNKNGHFAHNDFIGKPFGSKIRSTDNQGYGFVYLLKPTPELWARSLPHRTQIVHELDASMIVWYLQLKPNMVVCESGTGSGAMSHFILRTIAPHGVLHTFEFNQMRADTARKEFENNKVHGMVTVHHRDVCGKDGLGGGFGIGPQQAHAVFLDLPEPWLAVPHAAVTLKQGGRLGSYSPCMEQSQKTIQKLKECGFHSIKTIEVRLREHYVDPVELWGPPREKRPKVESNPIVSQKLSGKIPLEQQVPLVDDEETSSASRMGPPTKVVADAMMEEEGASALPGPPRKRMIVARPFATMRGHTAFLTFCTAGNKVQPDPNATKTTATATAAASVTTNGGATVDCGVGVSGEN